MLLYKVILYDRKGYILVITIYSMTKQSNERLHNNVRARTKTMRGFHGSISSANAIMKGYEIYYNFITKQQAIKCRPYELALADEDTREFLKELKNRWLGLIYLTKEADL